MKMSVRHESTWVVRHLYIEAMLGTSLYSYPYLNFQKCFVFLIIAYVFSSMKLEIRAEQVLPRRREGGRERERMGTGRRNVPNNVCTCE
jgi:hypothetical protein